MKLYRYEKCYVDSTPLQLDYNVIKETKCGFWIRTSDFGDSKKWVSNSGNKVFARPTKAEALNDLICRYKRRLEILHRQIEEAENLLEEAEKLLPNNAKN